MKIIHYKHQRLNMFFLAIITIFLHSCGQKNIPPEFIGKWETSKIIVTVRTKDEKRNFTFTSDTAIIALKVNSDYTLEGYLGSAKFENGKITTNWLLPVKMSGIAFTIECGQVGKIFKNDPLDSKEVELWLGPLKSNNIDGELRFTQGASHFPMAGFVLTKGMN
jgi:hypothetical protein